MRLTKKQILGLKSILYGNWSSVNKRTMTSLKKHGLTDGYELTTKGCDALNLPQVEASQNVKQARLVQDDILKIAKLQNLDLMLGVSQNMPADIKVIDLMTKVYPDYLGELRGVLSTLMIRYYAR